MDNDTNNGNDKRAEASGAPVKSVPDGAGVWHTLRAGIAGRGDNSAVRDATGAPQRAFARPVRAPRLATGSPAKAGLRKGPHPRSAPAWAALLAVALFAIFIVIAPYPHPLSTPPPVAVARTFLNTSIPIPTPVVSSLTSGGTTLLPGPVPTEEVYSTPTLSPMPTPEPRWNLRTLLAGVRIVAQARIIGSEKRPGSYTFIFYVSEWYKNEPGIRDNTVRLTLDTSKNWDKLAYLPRNLIGSDSMSEPFNFMLFLDGNAGAYSILAETAGIFYLRGDTGVETGAGAEQYQGMPVKLFKEALVAALPASPTPLPASPTPRPTPADGSPVSLIKVGDRYEVYVHRGVLRFGVGGMPVWLGPSRIQVLWSSGKAPYEGASYVVDVHAGTIQKYTPTQAQLMAYSGLTSADGKYALGMKEGTEDVWGVVLYNTATKEEQTVYDRHASVPQWAGSNVHEPGVPLSPGSPIWLSADTFILQLGASPATGLPVVKARLLLVSAASHKVRLLTKEGYSYSARYGMPLVYQTGDINGPLYILRAPYTGTPVKLTGGGPWIRDWTATPDGRRVAWVEAKAPPGDWSQRLPSACIPCGSRKDPEPQVQAIAIWDAATGKVSRHKPTGLVWTLGSAYFTQREGLHWRADGSAILYATHTAGSPGRSALYSVKPGGQPQLLAQHPWDGSINFLGEGGGGSIYYYVTGRKYYASGDLVRRMPDGALQVLHDNVSFNTWWVEPGKWLAALADGGVTVHDFATGSTRRALFPGKSPSPDELGGITVQNLVPVSPDGAWAAYAALSSDVPDPTLYGLPTPIGTQPDQGPGVLIVPVK